MSFVCRQDGRECTFDVTMASFQKCLQASRHLVVLSGAGVSAESGIPTFRGAGGLWRKFNAMDLATPEAFRSDPSIVWEFYHYRRDVVARSIPNRGHVALACLEEKFKTDGKTMTIITQNIDRLHHAAGSKNVVELHGSLWLVKHPGTVATTERSGQVWEDRTQPLCPALAGRGDPSVDAVFGSIPMSELPHRDGKLLRPAVVWFGEQLDPAVLRDTMAALEKCDLFIVVGTSSVVYPAAEFARTVAGRGVKVAEINLDPTPNSHCCAFNFRGKAGDVLPKVLGLEDETENRMSELEST